MRESDEWHYWGPDKTRKVTVFKSHENASIVEDKGLTFTSCDSTTTVHLKSDCVPKNESSLKVDVDKPNLSKDIPSSKVDSGFVKSSRNSELGFHLFTFPGSV